MKLERYPGVERKKLVIAVNALSMWKRFLANQLLLCLRLPHAVSYNSSSKCSSHSKCLNNSSRAITVKLGVASLLACVGLVFAWSCLLCEAIED